MTKASPSAAGTASFLQCYDIRTGEMYFDRLMFSGEANPGWNSKLSTMLRFTNRKHVL